MKIKFGGDKERFGKVKKNLEEGYSTHNKSRRSDSSCCLPLMESAKRGLEGPENDFSILYKK
jgi:hypothetical protein